MPGPVKGYPSFRTPPGLARSIKKVGWDACSTASNHTLDAGQYGVGTTLRALDRAGIPHSGSARSAAESRRIPMLDVDGLKVAFLAYTSISNGQAILTRGASAGRARGASSTTRGEHAARAPTW